MLSLSLSTADLGWNAFEFAKPIIGIERWEQAKPKDVSEILEQKE